MIPRKQHILFPGVCIMHQKKQDANIRSDPEQRLYPMFDSCSIKKFPAPDREEMGFRVLDNFPEEHIQQRSSRLRIFSLPIPRIDLSFY